MRHGTVRTDGYVRHGCSSTAERTVRTLSTVPKVMAPQGAYFIVRQAYILCAYSVLRCDRVRTLW